MEDVHRAGGIPAILGELDRGRAAAPRRALRALADAGRRGSPTGTSAAASPSARRVELFHAAPGGVRTTEPFSTANRWASLDTDAADGCIRDVAHAYTADGGLAILHGNLAPDGCVVKTAGRRRGAVALRGPGAGSSSRQEEAVDVILAKQVQRRRRAS